LFIKIAAEIKKNFQDAKFVVVGNDVWGTTVQMEDLKKQAKELDVLEDFIFTGWRDDIPNILKDLDALVLPSTSEPFPLVVLESMASGVIVFAHSGAGGPSEQIINEQDGFLIDCEKSEESAQKIVEILLDNLKADKIRQSARERVIKNCDVSVFIRKMESYFCERIRNKEVINED